MKRFCTLLLGLVGCMAAAVPYVAGAQTSVRGVIGAGGTAAISGSTVLVGTLGQPIIGPAGASNANAWQGFWYTIDVTTTPGSVREEYVTGEASAELSCSPNPFSAATTIRLRLAQSGHVRLTVYNSLGSAVRTLVDGDREAGALAVTLSGFELESGSYIAKLETGTTSRAIRLVVVK